MTNLDVSLNHTPTPEPPPKPPTERGAPRVSKLGPVAWGQKNLFNSWFNSILTVVLLLIIGNFVIGALLWAFSEAEWAVVTDNFGQFMSGLYPPDAYWRIWSMLGLIFLMAGLTWGLLARHQKKLLSQPVLIGLGAIALFAIILPITRPHILNLLVCLGLLVGMALAGQALGRKIPFAAQLISLGWFLSYFAVLYLLNGGEVRASFLYLVTRVLLSLLAGWQLSQRVSIPKLPQWLVKGSLFIAGVVVTYLILWNLPYVVPGLDFGIDNVRTSKWGGLTLTLLLAISGIVLCFPLGILLALGRRSKLPILRGFSVAYIELIRGVPLISILFMGQVLIPLFLPEGTRPDRIVRAVIGLTMFSAAYLAENIRAGLQAIPQGQTEAAQSLGLNKTLTTLLIVLPQAIKIAIPAIVGQFISLFQDTTLLSIVGLLEMLKMTRNLLVGASYSGDYVEAFLFIALIYWIFCYAMSYGSQRIEAALNTDLR